MSNDHRWRRDRIGRFPPTALLALLLALPACLTDQGEWTAFPLYRNDTVDGTERFALLWPLVSAESGADESTSWAFPLWFRHARGDENELHLAPMFPPLFMRHREPGLESEQWFPVYTWTRQGVAVDRTLLLLLAWWSRDEGLSAEQDGLTALGVNPLFRFREQGAGRWTSVVSALEIQPGVPLFSLVTADTSGLSFGAEGDARGLSLDVLSLGWKLVDVFHWDDVGSHDDLRFLTILASEDLSLFVRRTPRPGTPGADTARTAFFPVWWDVTDGAVRTRHLWPFYGRTTRDGAAVGHSVLFPVFRTLDDPAADRGALDVVFPIFGTRREGGRRHAWLFPLFDRVSDEHGSSWSTLLYLFGAGEHDGRRTLRLFWIDFDLDDEDAAADGP